MECGVHEEGCVPPSLTLELKGLHEEGFLQPSSTVENRMKYTRRIDQNRQPQPLRVEETCPLPRALCQVVCARDHGA